MFFSALFKRLISGAITLLLEVLPQERYYNALHGNKGKAGKAFAELVLASAAGFAGVRDVIPVRDAHGVELGVGKVSERLRRAHKNGVFDEHVT